MPDRLRARFILSNMFYIYKPDFGNLADKGLQYKDVITYVGIRSFYNEKDKFCFPSYRTIVKRVGCSIKFLRQSIERLKDAGLMQVYQVGRKRVKHFYKFNSNLSLFKIPAEILTSQDLSISEKASLVILKEYSAGITCYVSLEEISLKSGIIERTLQTNYQALLLKGYLVETLYEDLLNETVYPIFSFTDKFKWTFPKAVTHSTSIILSPAAKIDQIMEMALAMMAKTPRSVFKHR